MWSVLPGTKMTFILNHALIKQKNVMSYFSVQITKDVTIDEGQK